MKNYEQPFSASARDYLAQHTDALHRQLHRHSLLSQLMKPSIGRDTLAIILQGFYRSYRRSQLVITEHRCLANSAEVFDRLSTDPVADLEHDLCKLGVDNSSLIQDHMSVCEHIDLDEDVFPHYLWAWLYVTEGSRLGGIHIARQLKKHLKDVNIGQLRFFAETPVERDTAWPDLVEQLEHFYSQRSKQDLEITADFAQHHFRQLLNVFDELNEQTHLSDIKDRVAIAS